MRSPTPRPHHRVITLLAVTVAVLAACTPGGGEEEPSGPVTLKLQDYVIPAFQKQTADQGRQVTVEYVGTGADVFTPDGPWVG
jgi:hypothetical protein